MSYTALPMWHSAAVDLFNQLQHLTTHYECHTAVIGMQVITSLALTLGGVKHCSCQTLTALHTSYHTVD